MNNLNKVLLATSLVIGFSAVSHAKVEGFVGIGAGASSSQFNKAVPELSNDNKKIDAMGTYQIRGGAIINDSHRLSATIGRTAEKDNFKHSFGLVSYDYLIPVSKSGNAKVFVGGSAGRMHAEFKGEAAPEAQMKDKGYVYGAQAGFNYQMTDNLSTEIGYRYLKHEKKNSVDLDATGQLYVSVDYKF
jgi:opacity protein-like surface antigen